MSKEDNAQRRFWNYEDDDATADLNIREQGILDSGIYRGFDFVPTPNLTLTLNHATTGATFTKTDNTTSAKFGVLKTLHGTIVHEENQLELGIGTTASGIRCDIVVATHEYTAVSGGTTLTYSVLQGTDGNLNVPALPFPTKQMIVGYLFIDKTVGTGAAPTQLDDPGVYWVKNNVPIFAGKNQFKQSIAIPIVEALYDATKYRLAHNGQGNRFTISSVSGTLEYNPTGKPNEMRLDLIDRTEAGTIIEIENSSADNSPCHIWVNVGAAAYNSAVPISKAFTMGSGYAIEYIRPGETGVFISNGSDYYLVDIRGREKTYISGQSSGNDWTKIAEIHVSQQFDARRLEFIINKWSGSVRQKQRADITINVKQQSDMTNPLEFVDIVVSNDINFETSWIQGKVVTDTTDLKILEIYAYNTLSFSRFVLTPKMAYPSTSAIRLHAGQPVLTQAQYDTVSASQTIVTSHEEEQGWSSTGLTFAGTFEHEATHPVQYRRRGKLIEWRGIAYNPSTSIGSSPDVISGWPSDTQPDFTKMISAGVNCAGDKTAILRFNSGGNNIKLEEWTDPGSTLYITFDGIRYFTD